MESLKHWRYVCLEAKTSYQKNMLKSMSTVYALFLVTLAVGILWVQPDVTTSSTPARLTMEDIQPERLSDVPAAAAKGDAIDRHSGLAALIKALGHNTRQIKIVRDRSPSFKTEGIPVISRSDISPGVGPVLLSSHDHPGDRDQMIPSDGSGGSDLFGLGDNTFGLPNGLYVPPGVLATDDDDKYRTDEVLNAPVYLGLSVPRFPSLAEANDTGYVVVDITVDRDGYVSYDILSVYPVSRGFGPAVEGAILRGKFFPRVVNGYKVSHTTRMTLIMAKNQDPLSSKPEAEFTSNSPDVDPVWLFEK